MATAGVAIGLGNVWRFPYMMGEHGGSAFLVLYLVLVVAFGIPGLMAECALGRATGRGPMGALQRSGLPGGRLFATLIIMSVFMASSYYAVVLAYVLGETVFFSMQLAPIGSPESWRALGTPGPQQMVYIAVTIGLAGLVLAFGVRRGIERASRIGIPIFFVLFVLLITRVLTLDGAIDGLRSYLAPRPEQFTGETAFTALGQVFFSIGLGGTIMVTYGAYLRPDDSIPRITIGTIVMDVAAALLAGLIIVPAVLALGKDMARGWPLLFETLPDVFDAMPAGTGFGALFFGSVFLVGLLSLLAAYEVVIAAGQTIGWSRGRCLWLLLPAQVVLSVPALFFEHYVTVSDLVWGTTMMPVGSAVAIVAVGWCLGRSRALEEIGRGATVPCGGLLLIWLRYVMPVGIVTMLAYGWYEYLRDLRVPG